MRRAAGIILGVLIGAALVLAWRTGYFDATRRETISVAMRTAREVPMAPALYIVAYALVVILLLPTTAFSIIGGALFGLPGLGLAWLGAMAGSLSAHALGRFTGTGILRRFLGDHPMLQRLRDDASVLDLMRLRVLPVAPFGVLDYLAGMTGIGHRKLLVATGIAIVPTMIAYVVAGHQLALALSGRGSARRALAMAATVTVVAVLLAVLPTLAKLLSRRAK